MRPPNVPGTLHRARVKRKGQAAVEAALVIIPLLAVLCAIIDFSMAMFIRNSLVNAVREGVRYAITGQTGAGGAACQDASIKAVVQENAMGLLSGDEGLSRIQLTYYNPATLADVTALPNANAAGNVVRVTVTGVSWLWMLSGVWQNVAAVQQGAGTTYTGLTIGAASSDVMESPPNGVMPCR
jgi:Flp pilus assembly protein TadG